MAALPTFPSFDFSKLYLSKLDLSKLDLSQLELPTIDLSGVAGIAGIDPDKVRGVLRDAAYVMIGFGVLSVQQAQVRRRELAAKVSEFAERFPDLDLGTQLGTQLGAGRGQLDELVAALEARISQLDGRIDQLEQSLDQAVDAIGERLPDQAGALLGQAHEVAKLARKQVRGLLVNAA
ncbi:MAG: hypothetical protein KDB40_24125 [Acidimicrobiales bacterium]|nr:hypothetical protein [Acidimicrobiales bacterium]MCB9394810.1 hypothetical protein [Acidimicrobiaceae bacterium]